MKKESFYDAKVDEKDFISIDLSSHTATNHYYNPDSNEGGQWVEQHWTEEIIKQALDEFKDCDMTQRFNRPDCLDSEPATYLIDVTSDTFDGYEKGLVEAYEAGELIVVSNPYELKETLMKAAAKNI